MYLVKTIHINTKHMREGLVIIFIDNLKVKCAIEDRYSKVTQELQDGAAAISEIIDTIKKMIITIFIEYADRHKAIKSNKSFITYLGKFLIKECNKKAKE